MLKFSNEEVDFKVWLDDERPMPSDFHMHVKTATEAIAVLESMPVSVISLDHDLGEGSAGTGYEVATYIEQSAYNGTIDPIEVRIHSANPVGRQNMAAAIANAQRYWQNNSTI